MYKYVKSELVLKIFYSVQSKHIGQPEPQSHAEYE
jgi:hypothetical protein